MSLSVERLEQTGCALREALAQRDWAAIGELDLQCRQAIDAAMVDSPQDEEQLRNSMQQLLDLYRELVNTCRSEQQRLAGELRQLNQSQKSAKVYQLFG